MSSEFSELTCFFLCQVDGLPKLIKVYTGHTISGYTVGTGKVFNIARNYGRYELGCNADVEIEGITTENKATANVGSVPCILKKEDKIKLIYSDNDYSKAASIDPAGFETYFDMRVTALVILIILEFLSFLVAWGIINIGKRTVIDNSYTPLKLKLHKLSDKERSELTRDIENAEVTPYLIESFLNGIKRCAVKDENSAFSCKIAGMVLSSYCYTIKESELRKIAGDSIKLPETDTSEATAEDRKIYFLSPWKLRLFKPAPFMEIRFGEKSAYKYVMKPAKA